MKNNKKIFLLIGLKGSGKSYLGTIFEKEFGIKFIRVEDWAKKIKNNRSVYDEDYLKDVFEVIESGIRKSLTNFDETVFESTGLSEYFDSMMDKLKNDYKVITVKVIADKENCLKRIKRRDQSIHINVSDKDVEKINSLVIEKEFKADYEIINEDKTNKELAKEIGEIINYSST